MQNLKSWIQNLRVLPITNYIRGLVLCISVSCLIFYVDECYTKLKVFPEVLVNEKLVNSWTVPFPAVTICVPLLVKSEVLNLTKLEEKLERRESLDQNELIKLMAYVHVCPIKSIHPMLAKQEANFKVNHVDVLNQILLKIDDILNCPKNDVVDCDSLYIRSLTDYGYCFTFNMVEYHSLFNEGVSKSHDVYKRKKIKKNFDQFTNLSFNDYENITNEPMWTLEKGYAANVDVVDPLPATRGHSLKTLIKIHKNDFRNFCELRSKMIILCLHLPNEMPTAIHLNQYYELDKTNALKISAEIKQNDETLKRFDLQERGCYFEGEMSLKFFKSYTKINCEYECLINFTYEQCGCVKLTMPRSDDMRVCKINDIQCYSKVDYSWPSNFFKNSKRHANIDNFPCGCLPSCTQINYKIIGGVSIKSKDLNDGYQYSAISIEFDEAQIIKRTNYVTYKLQNFVSDIGGLIGLFLGFSLLSLFELLLKIFTNLKRMTDEWIHRLDQEFEEPRDSDTLTEVISVQEFRASEMSLREIFQSEGIYAVPGHVNASLGDVN